MVLVERFFWRHYPCLLTITVRIAPGYGRLRWELMLLALVFHARIAAAIRAALAQSVSVVLEHLQHTHRYSRGHSAPDKGAVSLLPCPCPRDEIQFETRLRTRCECRRAEFRRLS